MKMKTKLRRAEVRIVILESCLIGLLLGITIYGLIAVINGSLAAVLYTPLAAWVASLLGEDACRICEEAQRRDGNG